MKAKRKRKIPPMNELWLPEIEAAYKDEKQAMSFGYAVGSKITEHDLFQMASSVCLKFRGIKNTKKTRKKATDAALTSYVVNKDKNPVLLGPYMAFSFCYILSHYGLELIRETEAEELFCYIEDDLEKIKSGESLICFLVK